MAQAARGAAVPAPGATADATAAAPASPSAAHSKAAPMLDERLGTGHGEREVAPTTQVAFERASDRPADIVRLRYDSRANLVASGVIRLPQRTPPTAPDPFPAPFVPDPKG
jgi:hypothetical protein